MAEDPEVWTYVIDDAVRRGWGIAVRCDGCRREARWSDKDLSERFRGRLSVGVAAIRPVLRCACGARSPRLYFYQAGGLDIGARSALDRAIKQRLRGEGQPPDADETHADIHSKPN